MSGSSKDKSRISHMCNAAVSNNLFLFPCGYFELKMSVREVGPQENKYTPSASRVLNLLFLSLNNFFFLGHLLVYFQPWNGTIWSLQTYRGTLSPTLWLLCLFYIQFSNSDLYWPLVRKILLFLSFHTTSTNSLSAADIILTATFWLAISLNQTQCVVVSEWRW